MIDPKKPKPEPLILDPVVCVTVFNSGRSYRVTEADPNDRNRMRDGTSEYLVTAMTIVGKDGKRYRGFFAGLPVREELGRAARTAAEGG